MSDQPGSFSSGPAGDASSDDRLFAALAYIFSPISSIILLLLEDKKNRPFIRFHAYQSLVAGIALWVVGLLLSVTVILACLAPFVWLVMFFWAYKAYQGEYVNIPVVTNFIKNQGWV